jgi:nucleoside-diphosphate-sugar epimerase
MAEINCLNKRHPLYQEDLNAILGVKGIEELQGKRFLITGASGLIGVCLIDALMLYNQRGANISIYAVGRSKEKSITRLGEYYGDNHFHFIEQDVCNPLPQEVQVDYIIPLASNTHPLAYSQYPIETIEINVKGAEYALKKALECGAKVLYPSTVEVYGNARGNDVFTEDYTGQLNLSNARSCYTESKRVSEALCQSYIAEKGVDVKIVRLSRVFGPTVLISDTKASSQFIIKALQGEDIVLKSRGEQFFSYTYVADAVAAMLFVLVHGEVGVAYNIANEQCNVHLKDFAAACADVAGTKVVFDLPSETERKGFSIATQAVLCSDKIVKLGFMPKRTLRNAIERTIMILNWL